MKIHQYQIMSAYLDSLADGASTGEDEKHSDQIHFFTQQLVDLFSPSNFLWTNPDVLRKTAESGGMNLVAGLRNLIEGVAPLRAHAGQPIAAAGSDGHGVNIEGLAVRDGQLYVGFRGPVLEGTAYLLRVAAAASTASQRWPSMPGTASCTRAAARSIGRASQGAWISSSGSAASCGR